MNWSSFGVVGNIQKKIASFLPKTKTCVQRQKRRGNIQKKIASTFCAGYTSSTVARNIQKKIARRRVAQATNYGDLLKQHSKENSKLFVAIQSPGGGL